MHGVRARKGASQLDRREIAFIVEPADRLVRVAMGTDLDSVPWVLDHRVMEFIKSVLDRP